MSGGGEPRTGRGAVEPAAFTAGEHANAAEGARADTWRTIAVAGVDADGGGGWRFCGRGGGGGCWCCSEGGKTSEGIKK